MRCGAGAKLKNVAVEARRHGLSGMEFLEGIPGSVGGALRMNAGAMGGATFDVVESVRLMDFDGDVRELAPGEMSVAYRGCATVEKSHRAGRDVPGPAGFAGIHRAADERVQPEALGFAARRAERRLHVQESAGDSGGQVD